MKAKFFSTTTNNYRQEGAYPPGPTTLEDVVNAWLQENPNVRVLHIKQSVESQSFWSVGTSLFPFGTKKRMIEQLKGTRVWIKQGRSRAQHI